MPTQENDIIAGSIIYKDPQDNSREVLDFQLSDELTSKGGRQFEINYRNKSRMTSLSSRKIKVSTAEGLIEMIKSELETEGFEYVDTKTVPRKFKFEDQKTTDMLLSGKKLSENQQQNHFYQANGEYSEDKEYFTLGYRKFAPAGWAFFGGMVEPSQDAWENMTEELKEEAQQNLEDLTTTELGEFRKREVRGTCITTAYSQESKDLSTVQAGDDIEDVLFLDRQGLEHFLKNNNAQMVPHHFELMEELTAQGKLPNFIREAVIANNPSIDQGVVPDNLQSLLETIKPLSIKALLTNSGQSVSILSSDPTKTTTTSSFIGSFTQTESITFPATEFEDIFGYLPEPLTANQTKMIEARRVSGGAEEIITEAHQQFEIINQNETKTKTKESNMIKEEENNNEKTNNNIQELRDIAGVLGIEPKSEEFMAIAVDYIQKKALGIIPDPDADPQDPAPIKAADMRSEEVQKGYTEDLDAAFKAFSFSTHTKPDKFKKEYTEPENLKSIAEKYEADDKLFSDQSTAQKNAITPGQYYQKQQAAEKENKKEPNTQEEILQLIKDNFDAIAAETEVFEKAEVPVMLISDLITEEELGKLDNAEYTEAYKAGKWTSLQKDSKDMYPIGGSEDWPSKNWIKAYPNEEFYIDKGADGEDIVMYKKQETPNLLNLSDPAVIKILGNLTELSQPANWGEGSQKVGDNGAYLCMNDKDGEVYLIQKDENGNPESYQLSETEIASTTLDNVIQADPDCCDKLVDKFEAAHPNTKTQSKEGKRK